MSNENSLKRELIKGMALKGKSQREISRILKLSRNKVGEILKSNESVVCEKKENYLIAYEAGVLRLLEEKKYTMRQVHSQLSQKGIKVSYTTLTRYIAGLRKKEVYVPLIVDPGEEAQVDFGYCGYFNKGGKLVKVWVFCMVLSYSRYAYYREVTDQSMQTFIRCHMEAFEFFGGVPLLVKIDNLKAGVYKADFYEPTIQKEYANFLSYYNIAVVTARICRGQDKGKVESGIKYFKQNFLNAIGHNDYKRLSIDLKSWNKKVCNLRIHGTTRKIPQQLFFDHEKKQLRNLPSTRYLPIQKIQHRTVNSYGHVFYEYNFYSVPSEFSGEIIQLTSDGSTLKIYHNEKLCAIHVISRDRGEFVTIDSHKPKNKQYKSSESYLQRMALIGSFAVDFLKAIQEQKPYHWHKIAVGIMGLTKIYPSNVVNEACGRSLKFKNYSFNVVKDQCVSQMLVNEKFPALPKGLGGHAHDLAIYDSIESHYKLPSNPEEC